MSKTKETQQIIPEAVYESPEPNPVLAWPIQCIREGQVTEVKDWVVLEEPLEIVVNEQSIAVLMRMPGHEKELAAGFCVSEGYVRRATDILLLHHCGLGHPAPGGGSAELSESRNRIEAQVNPAGFSPPDRPDAIRLIRSGCGAAQASDLCDSLPPVESDLCVSASTLLESGRDMRALQRVHQQVGGTHAAGLFDQRGQALIVAEDIGRHNAVDKAIGHCLLWSIPMQNKILITSGRASYEMAMKAIRVGIPIVASLSAPTSLAVELAKDRGLTLIGYLRGGRMNVYTHAQRVQVD